MITPPAFEVQSGISPIVLSIPHTGDYIPADILDCFNDAGRQRIDTDWHIHRLYDALLPDATVVRALFHRYVIDANRDPAGGTLYTDRNVSALCPLFTFDGEPIYKSERHHPDEEQIRTRIARYHRPYHAAIEKALQSALRTHGIAILYDCHSIRSVVPSLFSGRLPDLNIGTYDGASCDKFVETTAYQTCAESHDYSVVLNNVFRGGWTTRHHGKPHTQVHAIQMEISQSTYMLEQPPWTMDSVKTQKLRRLLVKVLRNLAQAALSISTSTAHPH